MDVLPRPIPAFYSCYLLRSAAHHSSLYIGSTPHPSRRLAQHNGLSKGGAAHTSRSRLRPWEMTCVVHGFPSAVAALQFEWAWQNGHLTRHIPAEERVTHSSTATAGKNGRRKRVSRPRLSLQGCLGNLDVLIRANSFKRWPLEVRFFARDVWERWERWVVKSGGEGREGVVVRTEFGGEVEGNKGKGRAHREPVGGGLEALSVDYKPLKPYLEKSLEILGGDSTSSTARAAGKAVSCNLCEHPIPEDSDGRRSMALICSNEPCRGIFHLSCLAKHFLNGNSSDPEDLVPIKGKCPCCRHEIRWIDLIQELTVRTRDPNALAKLLKKPREKKKKEVGDGEKTVKKGKGKGKAKAKATEVAMEFRDSDDEGEDDTDSDSADEDARPLISLRANPPTITMKEAEKMTWHEIPDSEDEDDDIDDKLFLPRSSAPIVLD